jgi:CubicO group peptidase (beta-lactamase class C family)
MMVNGGRLPGHARVISERWIQETLNPDIRVKGLSPEKSPPERLRNGMRTYGYNNQWYIAEPEEAQDSDRILIAWGAFGQMLYVNLSRRTVGVHISAWDNPAPLFKWDEMVTFMNACARKLHPGSKPTR